MVSGSLNTTGRLVVRATVDGRSTMVARIAEMVAEAQASNASVQRLAELPGIEAVLPGDGWPVFADGSRVLRALASSLS